jgi:hypothetical protein
MMITKHQAKRLAKKINYLVQTSLADLHPNPVIILGHQKTGTSAIAALLSEATGKSATIDMFHLNNTKIPYFREDLYDGSLSLKSFVDLNKVSFSKAIIKEPDLTFHYESLLEIFPKATFVFVVRDPRDTIRSILNRLKIPGNLHRIKNAYNANLHGLKGWQLLMAGQYPHVCGATYIERMANRWNLAASIYDRHRENMTLIRYEDFLKDKTGSIHWLADQVNLPVSYDISQKVDVQYQPRGNRNITWLDFFGEANLSKIQTLCQDFMIRFDYLV